MEDSFWSLGLTHGLDILNGTNRHPLSSGFTCFPHGHGTSNIYHILTSTTLVLCIHEILVSCKPVIVALDQHIYL